VQRGVRRRCHRQLHPRRLGHAEQRGPRLDGAFALNAILETGILVAAGTGEVGALTVTGNGTLQVTGAAVQDNSCNSAPATADTAAALDIDRRRHLRHLR